MGISHNSSCVRRFHRLAKSIIKSFNKGDVMKILSSIKSIGECDKVIAELQLQLAKQSQALLDPVKVARNAKDRAKSLKLHGKPRKSVQYKTREYIEQVQGIKAKFIAGQNRAGLCEVEYGDLPMGTFFKCRLQMAKSVPMEIYTLIKSCGESCVIVSKGFDSGSMDSLPTDRMVMTQKPKKPLVSDNPNPPGSKRNRKEVDVNDWEF